jgi:hypothetical protein
VSLLLFCSLFKSHFIVFCLAITWACRANLQPDHKIQEAYRESCSEGIVGNWWSKCQGSDICTKCWGKLLCYSVVRNLWRNVVSFVNGKVLFCRHYGGMRLNMIRKKWFHIIQVLWNFNFCRAQMVQNYLRLWFYLRVWCWPLTPI